MACLMCNMSYVRPMFVLWGGGDFAVIVLADFFGPKLYFFMSI